MAIQNNKYADIWVFEFSKKKVCRNKRINNFPDKLIQHFVYNQNQVFLMMTLWWRFFSFLFFETLIYNNKMKVNNHKNYLSLTCFIISVQTKLQARNSLKEIQSICWSLKWNTLVSIKRLVKSYKFSRKSLHNS